MTSRNAPEWFGGGSKSPSGVTSTTENRSNKGGKKKHRRTKSDTSHLQSSSRKAVERELREKSRQKSKSKKQHRRVKSSSRDIITDTIVEDEGNNIRSSSHSSSRHETRSTLSSSLHEESYYLEPLQKNNVTHTRRHTVPSPQKKKTGNFFERILNFGRSENTLTTTTSLDDQPLQEATEPSIHFHVHKIEEKIDPEEFQPLAPPLSSLLSASNHSQEFPLRPNNFVDNQYHRQHKRLENVPYQKYNHSTAAFDHEAESDDQLTYSDDETANSISYHPYQQQSMATNALYPAYLSDEDYRNHEAYQVKQHQRLMALSHGQTNSKQGTLSSNSNSNNNMHRGYGSFSTVGRRDQHKPHVQDRFSPQSNNNNSDVNDMYISEDETLTSFHTQETYHNVDNFYFGRMQPSGKEDSMLSQLSESKVKTVFEPMQEDAKGEQETSPNSVNELVDMDVTEHIHNLDVSGHITNTETNIADDVGYKQYLERANPKIDEKNSEAIFEQMSEKTNSYKEDNISASSSNSNMKTPTTRSHSSGSANRINKNPPTTILQSHPPPPISSVKIIRTSGTETTVDSASSTSPHIKMLRKNSSSLSQKMQRTRQSRKEQKRRQKKIDHARRIEDYVRFLLEDCSNSDSYYFDENLNDVYSNRDAGFFPRSQPARNVFFSMLFTVQISIIAFLAFKYAGETILRSDTTQNEYDPFMIQSDDPFSTGSVLPAESASPISTWAKDIYVDYTNALQLSCITALYSTVLSALAIGMMMILSTAFIPTVLCVTVISCVVSGTLMMALSPFSVMPVVALAALAISLAYSIVVWDRIPFATTNLHTALVAIKSSADILLVGFSMMLVAFFWTMVWMVAFLGIYDHYLDNADHELRRSLTWVGLGVSSGMILSYVWTFNVILNIVHVTVAGVIGSWWTSVDSLSSCCTSVFREHFFEATTKSFGSICFGSLVVPPLGVMNFFLLFICPQATSKPPQIYLSLDHSSHEGSSLIGEHSMKSDKTPSSIYSQMLSPLDGVMRYFNDFGFTYIGIYRQGFMKSSLKASEVFQAREWSGTISDRLIPNVLRIICFLITLGSGFFGLVVEEYDGYRFTNFQKPTSTAFIIGCSIGYILSSVCLKVVESAVNAVLVCFSVAPYAFKHYHPVLSGEMRDSWGVFWLDELHPLFPESNV